MHFVLFLYDILSVLKLSFVSYINFIKFSPPMGSVYWFIVPPCICACLPLCLIICQVCSSLCVVCIVIVCSRPVHHTFGRHWLIINRTDIWHKIKLDRATGRMTELCLKVQITSWWHSENICGRNLWGMGHYI